MANDWTQWCGARVTQLGLTCWLIAQTKPESSRAIATTILLRLMPRALSRRNRARDATAA
ncbi:MAG: hypothetical protein AUG50_07165 [Betaproteobacteria bacterium 13_1_20CM_3_63_8]|nr:MAG: hypothetical protein AUG50_07165 [Betaproteobacteria bacterium 13_1_20CM_3_63_8]